MASKKKTQTGEIKVTLIKSTIGSNENQKANVEALGLKKIRQYKIHKDTPEIQGMLHKVSHLVSVEKI